MNIAFEHLAVPSPNPAGLRDWYVRVLGAREIFNNGQTPPTLLIALPGGGWFEIYAATIAPAGGPGQQQARRIPSRCPARGFD